MSILKSLLEKLAKFYGMSKALERLDASFKLGESSSIQIPREIAVESVEFATRGLLNMNAIQPNLDWVMPYWVNQQYNEKSSSYVPGTVLSTNQTHRNWTSIGCLDADREAIVDPTGLLTPWFDGWSVEFWVLKNDYLIVPAKNTEIYQYLVKQLPIVVSQFIKKDLRIRIEAFAHKIDGMEIICDSIQLENQESRSVDVSLFVSIRPYNPEGISSISRISYLEDGLTFLVNDSPGLFLNQQPDRVLCSDLRQGDCSFQVCTDASRGSIDCKKGLATAFCEYKLSFQPGEIKELEIRALTNPLRLSQEQGRKIFSLSYNEIKSQMVTAWETVLDRSMQIELPYQKLANNFNSNKAHLYLFIDHKTITPGPFTYHHEWFRDAAYSVTMLDKLGYTSEAEDILLNYPHRQKGDGYFRSQEGEWDSNGQALWTYQQHYLYTRNKEFVRSVFDSAYRGYKWIKKRRDKKTGLLPAGYSAEHFGPNDTFYWDNFWALAGIRGFAELCRVAEKEPMAAEAENYFKEYHKTVFDSIAGAQVKFPNPVIPSSPNRTLDPSLIGVIAALYPLRLVAPRDPYMTGTLHVIRDKYMKDNAFFHRVVHSGYNVYLTAQIAQCYLFRRSSRVLPILQWILDHITRTGTFPEAIHPLTGGGCFGDGHHGWACADFLSLVRNLLFFEEENGLVILPVSYHRWLEAGQIIKVKNGVSYFGAINFSILAEVDRIILNLNNYYSANPAFLEFTVPFSMSKVTADNLEIPPFKRNSVRFDINTKQVIVYR